MNKLLITGADGMVGYAFRKMDFPEVNYLTRKDVDLTDFSSTKTVFNLLKPGKVIHLAAVVGGIGGNMMHSGEFFHKNIVLINTENSRMFVFNFDELSSF